MGPDLVDAAPVEAGLRVLVRAGEEEAEVPGEACEPRDLLAGREQPRADERLGVLAALLRVLRVSRGGSAFLHGAQQAEEAVLHARRAGLL